MRREPYWSERGWLLVSLAGLLGLVVLWIYNLNRNPDPFPWSPAYEWTLPGSPVELHFVEKRGTLLVLCSDAARRVRSETASIVECDMKTGAVSSSCTLAYPTVGQSMPAAGLTMAASEDSVLVAAFISSPDEKYLWSGLPDGGRLRPHVLRMTTLRLSDWGVESRTEEELEPTSTSTAWWGRVGVRWMGVRNCWAVGIGDRKAGTYRVSLRDPKTLAELDSRTFPKTLGPLLCVDDKHPATILVGGANSDRWDVWKTDTGEVSCIETSPFRGQLGLPDDMSLSEYSLSTRGGEATAFSPQARYFAEALNGMTLSVLPTPTWKDNCFLTDLEIRSLPEDEPIVRGMFQGQANAIGALRFGPDNRWLITGHEGGAVRLWDLSQGTAEK